MQVTSDNIQRVFTSDERVDACRWRNYVRIEPCTHTTPTEGSDHTEALTYTYFNSDRHEMICRYCGLDELVRHTYPDGQPCVCGST